MLRRQWILFLTIFWPFYGLASGTVVGNGGDPLLHFLEANRFALVETVRAVQLDPQLNASFCKEELALSATQQKFCRDYFLEISDQMVSLNTEPNAVSFVLRLDPLFVIGPDGQPMPVAAKTNLGAGGPIEFHLDSIKLMPPKVLLQLIGHEFQHKTVFRNSSPTDNDPLGPFQTGRVLIDSVASALVKVAVKRGFIGTEFTLRDSFECLIGSGGAPSGMRTSTQRRFFDPSMVGYQVSLSVQPSDPLVYARESLSSKIVYQLEVTDTNHCVDLSDRSLRQTRVSLWRMFDDANQVPVVLFERRMDGFNPLCEKNPTDIVADFQSFHFACHYYGSAAQ